MGQPFRALVPSEVADTSGRPARPEGESGPDGRIWVEVSVHDGHTDGVRSLIPAVDGGAIMATLRILPRGAGAHELRRASKKIEPSTIAAIIAAIVIATYYVGFR